MGRPQPHKWKPSNPDKYAGDPDNIWVRSSWELKLLRYLDSSPQVIKYSSEEIVIPYMNPLDNRIHRYFPDAYAEVQTKDGTIKKFLIEVKPHAQTIPPVKPKRQSQRYIQESVTYVINSSKWKQAEKFCQEHGWHFLIMDEYTLQIKR